MHCFLQFITQRGYCQIDDVVTNTVGMLVGWVIWQVFHKAVIKYEKYLKQIIEK